MQELKKPYERRGWILIILLRIRTPIFWEKRYCPEEWSFSKKGVFFKKDNGLISLGGFDRRRD